MPARNNRNTRTPTIRTVVLVVLLTILSVASSTFASTNSGNMHKKNSSRRSSQPLKNTLADALDPPGKACRFFVWDALSAILHNWCRNLSFEHTYEGRGGKKVCVYHVCRYIQFVCLFVFVPVCGFVRSFARSLIRLRELPTMGSQKEKRTGGLANWWRCFLEPTQMHTHAHTHIHKQPQ